MKNKRLISLVLSFILVAGTLVGVTMPDATQKVNAVSTDMAETSANQYGLLDQVEGGLILHCWCWSFNTIKANLEKIADAGYTAVQTSPITKCVVGDGGGMQLNGNGKWYYHYQPTAYTIGNYQLGTEAEFKSLCQAAHSYGIKVIADVVANHTTTDRNAVDSSLKNISGGCYHNNGSGIDYSNRRQITQNDLISLPDLNTQNPNVQNVILNFLKQAVADGADGFRYDAAKHIELPDDDSSYASNFWPTVLNNGSSFQYGEILEDSYGTARSEAYSKLMHVTASSYGYKLREQIAARQITANAMSQYYMTGVSPDRMVTWVESHDNYCDNNTWKDYSNTQIRLCWAIAVAQGDTTSLFFNRPNGSSQSNMWGNNQIGATGDSNYCDPEVVAVNRFHNAMYGQDKSLKNLNSKAVLMISRGSSGVTIINSGTDSVNVNTETDLKDGTYTDYAHGGTFTVSNGILTGTVGKEQIAVIYTDNVVRDPSVSISYNGNNAGGEFYDVAEVTLKANYATSSYYQINSGNKISYSSGEVIRIGENMSEGESVTLTLSAVGEEGTTPAQKSYTFTKVSRPALEGTTCVYYDNSSTNWNEVYVYVYRDNGNVTNGSWPGQPMKDLGDGIWGYAIDESFSDAYVIFNNNNNGQQDPQGQGYTINKGEKKILANGSWSNYVTPTKPTTAPTQITTATTQPTTATVPTQAPKYYGDANCDGAVTILDVSAVQKCLADHITLSSEGLVLAKVYGDNLSIKDATCIQKYLVGFGTGIGLAGKKYN